MIMGSVAGQGDARSAGGVAVGPFAAASRVRPLGDGTFTAELPAAWTVRGRPHGGFLLALLAKTAMATHSGGSGAPLGDPLAGGVEFLHPPRVGPRLLPTQPRQSRPPGPGVSGPLRPRGQRRLGGGGAPRRV